MSLPAVDIRLQPSALAHRWLFWAHALPLLLIPLAVSHTAWMLGLAAAIGLSWLAGRRHRAFGHGRGAIVHLLATPDARWQLGGPGGAQVEAELLGSTVMAAQLMVLQFRLPSGARRTRVLFGDEAPAEALRRLRVRLVAERS